MLLAHVDVAGVLTAPSVAHTMYGGGFPAGGDPTSARAGQRIQYSPQLQQWASGGQEAEGIHERFVRFGQHSLPAASESYPHSVSEYPLSVSGKSIASNEYLSDAGTISTGYLSPPSPSPAMVGLQVAARRAPSSTPSLVHSGQTFSGSGSSAATSAAGAFPRKEVLEEDQDGNLYRRAPPVLECPVANIFGCSGRFANEEDCRAHSLHHFRRVSPPQRAGCPYNCGSTYSDPDGHRGWGTLVNHIATYHIGAPTLRHVPASRELLKFFFRTKLIDTPRYQQLLQQRSGTVVPSTYVARETTRRNGQ